MKTLKNIRPTSEQLLLITHPQLGIRVIRGAAGSGKTTTSILMMKTAIGYVVDHFISINSSKKVTIRVFTFNRTLSAYVNDLIDDMASTFSSINEKIDLEVVTLGKYFRSKFPRANIIDDELRERLICQYSNKISFDSDFILDEVEYILGRFQPENIEDYIDIQRVGRGNKPRVDKNIRRQLLDDVIYPYISYKRREKIVDWHDFANHFSCNKIESIDVAIIDEAQDFSANQLKAIVNQLSPEGYTTIVLDSAQQIYKRGFTWKEVGINSAVYSRLERNYRNTYEIALFAHNFLLSANIQMDDNATLPKLDRISNHGNKPIVVIADFPDQISYIIDYITKNINLREESIGFLHPKGGGWFKYLKQRLDNAKLDYIDITRTGTWPKGDVNIALSTIHSAKGLEFDYVFIVGAEDRHFNFESPDFEDINYSSAIKLFSMGISRAKKNVVISYKNETKPVFFEHLDLKTYEEILL